MTHALSGIRAGRVFAAAFLAVATSAVLVALVIFAYAFVLGFEARGQPDQAEVQRFADAVAPWLGPILAWLLTVGAAAWVAARVAERPVLHGLLVGSVVAAGVLAIEIGQGGGLAGLLNLVPSVGAGWLGGWLVSARRRSTDRSAT